MAWWLSRKLGYCRQKSAGIRPVVWLVLIAFCAWLTERLLNLLAGTIFELWKILTLYVVIVLLILWVWQARKRTIVEVFADHTSDQPKSVKRGLSTLLVVELARLRELHRTVDESRPIHTAVKAGGSVKAPVKSQAVKSDSNIEATVTAEDVSEFQRSAVSAESEFGFGPLRIPVGTLMALIGRLVRGPQIIGSLYKDDARLILTAQMVYGKRPYSWRVDDPVSITQPTSQGLRSLDDMVTELACRIFTDLMWGGSVRWRALWAFNQGLRAYRNCLRTRGVCKMGLKRAERKFIEVLAEDSTFASAYYNLGVVYTELDQSKKAERAFSKAIAENPAQWEAYYALALNHYSRGQYDSAIQLCKRVTTLKKDDAKAYDLMGLAQRHNGDLKGAIESRKKAVAKSWKALCSAELRGESIPETEDNAIQRLKTVARDSLSNQAVAYFYQAQESEGSRREHAFQSATCLFRQALRLDPSDAKWYFELGKTYYEWVKYDKAARAYESAIQIEPANAEFWAYLALVYAAQNNEVSAQHACDEVLDCASVASDEALKRVAETYEKLGMTAQSQCVERRSNLSRELEEDEQKDESPTQKFKKKLAIYNHKGREWEYAQVCIALGNSYLNSNDPKNAETCFQKAIDKLKAKHPQEITHWGLRALLAHSILLDNRPNEALQHAEEAIKDDPINAFERKVLGDVYFDLNEFESAKAAWKNALLRDPDDPYIYTKIGFIYSRFAQHCHDTKRRNTVLHKAVKYSRKAIDLCDSQEEYGWTHHVIGTLYYELNEYDKAISHLRSAQTRDFAQLITTYYLGWVYLKSKAYMDCEEEFSQLIKNAEDRIPRDKPTTDEIQNIVNEIVEPESLAQKSLGELLLSAYLSLAVSYAERDANLEKALSLTQKAERYIELLEEGTTKEQCKAAHAGCTGWILYKKGRIDEAIRYLERAVSVIADAEAYFHLAIVYERKLEDCKDPARLPSLIRRAQACCQHVREIDFKHDYAVSDLLRRLQEIRMADQQKQ